MSLHHVIAIAGHPQRTLDFYAGGDPHGLLVELVALPHVAGGEAS